MPSVAGCGNFSRGATGRERLITAPVSEEEVLQRQIAALEKIIVLKEKAAAIPAAAPDAAAGAVAGLIPVRKDVERDKEFSDLLQRASDTLDSTRTAVENYAARLADLDKQLAADPRQARTG